MIVETNDYKVEKEARERRLIAYTDYSGTLWFFRKYPFPY